MMMDSMMTPAQLAALREAVEKATPGPWVVSDGGRSNYVASVTALSTTAKVFNVAMLARPMRGDVHANAALIAAAPALLSEIERLTRERDAYRENLRKYVPPVLDAMRAASPQCADFADRIAVAITQSALTTQPGDTK
jgi:hypothetical protein